jgi:hypothetical protein
VQTVTNLRFRLRELAQQHATGRLLVKLPGTLATVYFNGGNIVHATLGSKKGPEALAMILLAEPKSSDFRAHLSAPETTIQDSLESLLGTSLESPLTHSEAEQTLTTNVPQSFVSDVAKLLVEVVGPIGSIVLDDALTELNLDDTMPRQAVQPFVAELIKQLKPWARQPFQSKVSTLLDRYGFRKLV